ncbi:hypothetical protein [Achromobacter phage Motura]|uniref:Uncharacterized protein n=1 Tax=Achromobacter phage Motura TaxID=2591403 RepID=A0A514CTB5_9CAUD|nr:hypothetical protein H1O15_gp126 [Achromobacter phage Motura]QDH83727.1 hypothetical protein [Achromobacter phage Motura]
MFEFGALGLECIYDFPYAFGEQTFRQVLCWIASFAFFLLFGIVDPALRWRLVLASRKRSTQALCS